MGRLGLKTFFLLGTALGAAVAASPALAQDETPIGSAAGQSETAQGERAGGLEEIVVTARRRAESVQSIPVSVQAISAEQIQQRDLTSLEKIAAATPQFSIGRSSNGAGAQLTLRGIGSSATSIGIEQSVAVVVDGVYYGQGRTINEGFFDLERVEILKGPQSLFFGKNATAGVISLTTADPGSTPEYIARVGYEFAAENLYGEAIISQPLSDTLGVRVAVRASEMFGGYYTNVQVPVDYGTTDIATGDFTNHVAAPAAEEQPQERNLIGRVTLQYEPSSRFTATLKASGTINKTEGNGWNYVAIRCPGGSTTIAPSYPCDGGFVIHQNDMPTDIAEVYPYAKDGGLYNDYESWQVTGNLEYGFDYVTVTSITNYNTNTNEFLCDCDFLSGTVWATENTGYRSFSQELRALTSFQGSFNFLAGALYQDTRRDFFQAVMFANVEDSSVAPENRYVAYNKLSETDGRTLSAYGQVIWEITPTLEATAGVRYINETKDSFFTQPYVNAALTGIFRPESAAVNGTLFADQTFNDWSPDITLSWTPTPDLLIYGAYKSAYKSGGYSNSAINSALAPNPAADLQFEPEKGKGFEVGIKSTVLDNQLRANLTLYDYEYTDLQIDFFNAQIFAYVTYNAGRATTRGAELELEFAPRAAPGLTLSGTLNYNEARYSDFLAPCYSGQSIERGCTIVQDGVPLQDLSGVPTANAPEWTGTLGASYESDVGTDFLIGGNANLRYSDSYLGSSFGDFFTEQDAYAVIDAGIYFGPVDESWQLALIGKNLTDQFYFIGGGTAPLTGSGTGTAAAIPGDNTGYGSLPRTVAVQATVRF
ncbi:MAG: TonB-dependent receptor [Erythrobacter sp.]|uniref:TonB-dependent receptor n=1 Tax=Erythrobacter sp. TaxID=1042 RepID=UPI003C72D626